MTNCYYCEKGGALDQRMLPIKEMGCASIYLYRDQTHKGKCIVVYNKAHKTEWFQLDEVEQYQLIHAVSETARVLNEIFHPGKINYATYGDCVSHLHVHVVPKYEGGPDWGGPFSDSRPPLMLSEDEYQEIILQIQMHLHGTN